MAYCRWSSMNWRCDIYCYQHVDGGYTTHVASNRVLGDIPAEPSWDLIQTNQEQWVIEHKAVMDFLETCKRERIGLLHDGETFNDPDLETFRARLMDLRAAGYVFPDYVLEEIDEEMKEDKDGTELEHG